MLDNLDRFRKRATSLSIDALRNAVKPKAQKVKRFLTTSTFRQQPTPPPEPRPKPSEGPNCGKEDADFARKEYLPWLERKVKYMTAERRTEFLREFPVENLVKMQAVLAYLAAHPEHVPPTEPCKEPMEREERGFNPSLDPLTLSVQLERFPRVFDGESMFCSVERRLEADVGSRDELRSDGEVLSTGRRDKWSRGGLRGLGRYLLRKIRRSKFRRGK